MDSVKNYLEGVLSECNRIIEHMKKEYPGTGDYKSMVDALVSLDGIVDSIEMDAWRTSVRAYDAPLEAIVKDVHKQPEETEVKQEEKKEEEPPFREPEPKLVGGEGPTVLDEPPTYTKEYIRGLLEEKAASGVLIMPILEKYIPEGKPVKFPSIKAADYPALVEDLNNAE